MQPSYAELHCISNFSFLRGASHPDELVKRAQALGYHALALTDECSVAGTVRAHLAAREHAFKLIIGAEFVPADAPHRKLVLLAQNRNGYGNLCELISLVRGRAKKGAYELRTADLAAGIADCLALLVGDLDTSEDDATHDTTDDCEHDAGHGDPAECDPQHRLFASAVSQPWREGVAEHGQHAGDAE